ncbi:MAG: hypothetical protein MUP85_21980 [Candidatus Lokiarchaeota archaeon]|nr:hypothetical protein [Candidatus Lokiarchaeota archaeon]
MTNQETDNNISGFLDEWYSDDSQNMLSVLKLSLTKEILSSFSKEHLSKKNHTFLIGYKNSGRIFWSIKKTFWFFLWCFKWAAAFKTNKNKKVLLAAIGSNLNNIDVYLEQLSAAAKKNNCVIVLLNIIESYKHLRNHQLFYFPRFFYTEGHSADKEKINNYASEIINSIKILTVKNKIKFSLGSEHLIKPIKSLIRDYSGFSYLVTKLISPNLIVGLIQDYDYTYNKFIYYKIARWNSIKTGTIDSSLLLYQHLYRKTFSDYHLVWGEYKKNYILKNNKIDPSKIIVIGKPLPLKNNYQHLADKRDLWVYIAQSYTEPSMFVSGRDFASFEVNIKTLSNFQKKNYPNDQFILKIHPADKSANYKLGITKSPKGSVFELVKNARIIFVEDSTLAVELFANNFPIVYVLDKCKNDNIGLVNNGLVPGLDITGEFDKTIISILNEKSQPNAQRREKFINYYLGNFNENNFQNVITKILFSEQD